MMREEEKEQKRESITFFIYIVYHI